MYPLSATINVLFSKNNYKIICFQLPTINHDVHFKTWPLTHESTLFTQTQQWWEVSIPLEHYSWTKNNKNLESMVIIIKKMWDFVPYTMHLLILCLTLWIHWVSMAWCQLEVGSSIYCGVSCSWSCMALRRIYICMLVAPVVLLTQQPSGNGCGLSLRHWQICNTMLWVTLYYCVFFPY